MSMVGKAFIVGAGPGRPDLITVRGLNRLKKAEVVLYDRLIPGALLDQVSPDCELIFVGKRAGHHPKPQAVISEMLIELVRQGKRVVRLKGGDPFVFGRGGEEALALAAHNLPFEIIPGLTSAIAVPSYGGVPVTEKGISGSFTILTGHEDPTKPESMLNWPVLAQRPTLVILMAVKNLPNISHKLIQAGKAGTTPAIAISHGTSTAQQTVIGTLETLPIQVQAAKLPTPAIIVIGETARLSSQYAWFQPDIDQAQASAPRHQTAFQTDGYPDSSRIALVGAGPGHPDLITVRGRSLLRSADMILHDRLVHQALLNESNPQAELINVGKSPLRDRFSQDEINRLLVDAAQSGKRVVRLKGGDPFVFGLGGSECNALNQAGIPYEVVPGLSSATAVPALAGIPVTHRGVATALTVLSGHKLTEDWEKIPQYSTLVILMGVKRLPEIVSHLQARGRSPETPVAVIASGSTEQEILLIGTLGTISDQVTAQREQVVPPSLLIVGDVVRFQATIGRSQTAEKAVERVWGIARR